MNDHDPERERLLRVALRERAGVAPTDVTERVLARLGETGTSAGPSRRGWVAAAIVVLGFAVVSGIALTRRGSGDGSGAGSGEASAGQDPERVQDPLDLLMTANGDPVRQRHPWRPGSGIQPAAEMPALPDQEPPRADLRSLKLQVIAGRPPTIDCVAELPELEHVWIGCSVPRGLPGIAVAPALDCLEPLATCPRLRVLELSGIAGLRPAHLAPLAGAASLTTLALQGSIALDEALVAAIARLPMLRTLELDGLRVTTAGLAKLGELDRLQHLRVIDLENLPPARLAFVTRLRELRTLAIGFPLLGGLANGLSRRLLSPEFLASLRALPKLTELELSNLQLTPEHVESLPRSLRCLTVWNWQAPVVELAAALDDLPVLDELAVTFLAPREPDVGASILARLLRDKLFKRLHLGVEVCRPEVVAALAGQHLLTDLGFALVPREAAPDFTLDFVKVLPALERLELECAARSFAAGECESFFKILESHPRLRELAMWDVELRDMKAVHEMLGSGRENNVKLHSSTK